MRPLVVLFLILVAGRAQAAAIPSYDLASLVHLSEQVVVADLLGDPGPDPDRMRFRVTRVHKGTLHAGQELEVETELLSLEAHRGPRALLFLWKSDDGLWRLEPTGFRLIDGQGAVWRPVQLSNPGGYQLVPAGHDPADVLGEDDDPPRCDEVLLEALLERAIARAGRVERALADRDRGRRLATLVTLAPRPRRFPEPVRGLTVFPEDALALRVLEAIWTSGDADAILAVLGREEPGFPVHFRSVVATIEPRLEALVRDRTAPAHQRVGALELLGKKVDAAALLGDPEPWVRCAAAPLASPSAVRARQAVEKDEQVSFCLALAAHTPAITTAPTAGQAAPGVARLVVRFTGLELEQITLDGRAGTVVGGFMGDEARWTVEWTGLATGPVRGVITAREKGGKSRVLRPPLLDVR